VSSLPDPEPRRVVMGVVREAREHSLVHGGARNCPLCELWAAYTKRDLAALDALTERMRGAETLNVPFGTDG